MLDLVEQIKLSLIGQSNLLWLPHLTKGLVKLGWQNLTHPSGLTKFNYSTGRLVSGNPEAQCVIAARLFPQVNPLEGDESLIYIELLTEDISLKYQKGGVSFYTAEEITSMSVLDCLADAITILKLVPTLSNTVAALVKALHIIKPENDEYDVSFTEPHIPFSVFVSVPLKRMPNDVLRTAEGILHEAMHLQLTLIERVIPLVKHSDKKYYSPWRGECRTAQGVIHALYVFRVIQQFLESLLSLQHTNVNYIRKRREEIAGQIEEIRSFKDCPDLTHEGRSFVQWLLLNKPSTAQAPNIA